MAVIPLKGLALREMVYPDAVLRPSGDVDLLVRAADVPQAEETLLALGYVADETYHPATWYRPENTHHLIPYRLPARAVLVELHWNLAPPEAHLPIEMADLWQRAVVGQLAGRPVRCLAPADLVAYLGLHAALLNGSLMRLRHLVDLAETVRCLGVQLDGDELSLRARAWGIQSHLYLALRVTQELLGLDGGADVLAKLRPAGFQENLVGAARRRVLALGRLATQEWMTDHWMALALAESRREKLRLLWRLFVPDRDRMAELYHLPPQSKRLTWYYLIRPFQLLGRYARRLDAFGG